MSKPIKLKKKIREKEGQVFLYDDHKLLTRRDFLNAGLIQFSATVTAPTLLHLLLSSPEARAACSDQTESPSTMPAFVQLNLSGGAILGANFVGRKQNGDLITNYNLMGLGSKTLLETPPAEAGLTTSPNRLVSLGGANRGFFYRSGFLRGLLGVTITNFNNLNTAQRAAALRAVLVDPNGNIVNGTTLTAPPSYLAKTQIISILTQTRDDTNMNKLDPSGMLRLAGLYGTKLPILTSSNFGQTPAWFDPPTPLTVNSLSDLSGAVGVQGVLGQLKASNPTRGPAMLQAAFDLVKKISDRQIASIVASNKSALVDSLGCATDKNAKIAATTPPNVDPRLDGTVTLTDVWNFAPGNNEFFNSDPVFGFSVYAQLKDGLAGSVRLNLGGYDYHDNTRDSGDVKDYLAGSQARKVLQTAERMGKKLFLYVSTDGAVRSAESASDDAPWVSDRGQAGTTLLLVYDPAGQPAISAPSGTYANQIGFMGEGQNADNNYIPAWNDEKASLTVIANYLRFAYGNAMTGSLPTWKVEYARILDVAKAKMGLSTTRNAQDLSSSSDPIDVVNTLPKLVRI